MLEGKISAASKLINSAEQIFGVHEPTPAVLEQLRAKPPPAQPVNEEALIKGERPDVLDAVIF